jgi:hypothetical protein
MELDSDKGRTTLALLISKVWENDELKRELQQNPQQVLKDEGIDLPEGVTVKVLENTDTVRYIPLTRNFDPARDKEKAGALISQMLPIPDGKEVRMVQSTDDTYYIVIPAPPSAEKRATFTDALAVAMVADAGSQSIWQDTTETQVINSIEAALVIAEISNSLQIDNSVVVTTEATIVII